MVKRLSLGLVACLAILLTSALREQRPPAESNATWRTVVRVVDGDTLLLDRNERVRLIGVDTPESGARCYAEAKDRFTGLAGSTSRVEAGPRAVGPFDRLLYYVYTMDGRQHRRCINPRREWESLDPRRPAPGLLDGPGEIG